MLWEVVDAVGATDIPHEVEEEAATNDWFFHCFSSLNTVRKPT